MWAFRLMQMDTKIFIRDANGAFKRFPASSPPYRPGIPNEIARPLPRYLGQGLFSSLECRPGMDICLSRCRFDRDYQAKITWPSPMVTFAFCLSGQTLTRNTCRKAPIEMGAGDAYLHYFEDPSLVRDTRGKKELSALAVRIAPGLMADLAAPSPESAPTADDRIQAALDRQHLFSRRAMTPDMTRTLYQMVNCPHQGLVRRIFLESKALELVAALLALAFEPPRPGKQPRPVSPDEQERIIMARDILVSRIQFPPSLPCIARKAGMSHARLTRGFKKVFGCTVFEYLRRERLAYARTLLRENRLSVTEVAFEAGFCSSSHFAAAFLKQFGKSPTTFRNGAVTGRVCNRSHRSEWDTAPKEAKASVKDTGL